MKSIKEYLTYFEKSDVPSWLSSYKKGQAFSAQKFFAEKTVFYPGSGCDGHPVALFGGSHAAHSFIYADYGISAKSIIEGLNDSARGFHGYDLFEVLELQERDIVPNGWRPTLAYENLKHRIKGMNRFAIEKFAFLAVLERKDKFDEKHGPERLAILFLGADGIASYDAIYCQPNSFESPFAILIEDHGFGGNYDSFGSGSLLEKISESAIISPKYILTNNSGRLWHSYKDLNLDHSVGGMHRTHRRLYKKCHG